MGKRPRTPHFITGIGDGNVNLPDSHKNVPNDDLFMLGGNTNHKGSRAAGAGDNSANRYVRSRKSNERLIRLEQPLTASDHWKDVFGSGGSTIGKQTASITGPWQVSAFALLGMVVVISAIFLHMVSDNSNENNTPYSNRRRQRHARRMYKTRKKKTDEWSDDEEPLQNGAGILPDRRSPAASAVGGVAVPAVAVAPAIAPAGEDVHPFYPYYYHQPANPAIAVAPRFSTQEHRLRRTGMSSKDPTTPPAASSGGGGGRSAYYLPTNNPTYKSPSANLLNLTPARAPPVAGSAVHRRGISPKNSFSSTGPSPRASNPYSNMYVSTNSNSGALSPTAVMRSTAPLSGKLRVPTPPSAKDIFPSVTRTSSGSSIHGSLHGVSRPTLPTPPEESQLPDEDAQNTNTMSGVHDLGEGSNTDSSNFPSFDSISTQNSSRSQPSSRRARKSSDDSMKLGSIDSHNSAYLQSSMAFGSHHHRLLLSPGNYDMETPIIANARKTVDSNAFHNTTTPGLNDALQPPGMEDHGFVASPRDMLIPFIPTLDASKHKEVDLHLHHSPPPRSVLMDELRLVQMETGSSMHWEVKEPSDGLDVEESHTSFYGDDPTGELNFASQSYDDSEDSEEGSDISIPSGDPRKCIVHKRKDLTMSTDSATSLQSSIDFEELKLQEVIGGGGFGQVWRATWRGTPVAVKVLTGSAQNKHIARAILEEFKAEINLLKGMRHPNICLYMGACIDPPNRAIVTELAANGSVWDALRLPLMPPYVSADGTQRGAWPVQLYLPDEHGAPPTDFGMPPRMSAPIPPKGTWPWQLVKRVACGAARGMAYLHSGKPPVLHRDLKSANLLLDDSYTTKVCDFGLSRLKAQARSMTGNCGTVQWMAPEVLANMKYDEKADVFSFGIILWELLSRECPYEGMTAIQCALAVLNRDKRPEIPKWCPPAFHALIKSCVKKEPDQRPSFAQVILALDAMDV